MASHTIIDPAAIANAQLDPVYFVALVERRSRDLLIRLLISGPCEPEKVSARARPIAPRGGYSTQIVIFGSDEQQPASGNIYFFDPDGQPIDPPVE